MIFDIFLNCIKEKILHVRNKSSNVLKTNINYMYSAFIIDVPVWSKLENGRIPSSSEMFQIIDNHMRLHKDTSPA